MEILTEDQETKNGEVLAIGLMLKKDPEHKGWWLTKWGSKSSLGLWRMLSHIVDEMREDDLQERLDNNG